MCLAIKHIHDRKILHRDLKAKNVFLTKQGLVKVGDFGVSKVLRLTGEFAATCIGTPIYMSPEVINNAKYNSKSDIWSLGCILYELMCLKVPFTGGSLQQLYRNIASQQAAFPSGQNYSRDLISIAKTMLEKNPKMRPGINSVLKQPVLKSRLDMYVDQFKIQQEFCHTVLHGRHLMQEARIPSEKAIPVTPQQVQAPPKEIKREIAPPPAVNPFSPLLNKPKEQDPVLAYQALLDRARAEERARREKLAADQLKIENIQKQKREEMEKEKRRQRLLQEERELQKLKQIRQQNQQILAALELNKKKPKDLAGIYGGPVVVKHQPKEDKVPVRAKVEKIEDKVRDYDKPWIQAVKQQFENDKIRKKKPSSNHKSRDNVLAKEEVARLKDDSSDSSKEEKVKNVEEPKIVVVPKDRQVVGKWLESLQQKMNILKNDVIAMKKVPSDVALNPGVPLKNPRQDQAGISPIMSPRQAEKVSKEKKKSSEKSKPAALNNQPLKKNPSRKSISPEPDHKEMLQHRKVVREQKRAGFQDFLKQQKLAAKQAAPSPLVLDNELGTPSVDAFIAGSSPDYEFEKSPAVVDIPRKKIVKSSSNQAIIQKKEKMSLEEFKALKNKERMEMIAYLKQRPGAGPSPLDGGPSVELHYHGKKTKSSSSKKELVLESIDVNEHDRRILSNESPIKPLSLVDLGDNIEDDVTVEMKFQQTLYSDRNATSGEPPMMFQRTLYSDQHTSGEPPLMFQQTLYSKTCESSISSPRQLMQQAGGKWTSPILRIDDDDEDYENGDDIDNEEYEYYLQQQRQNENEQQDQDEQQDQPPVETGSDESDTENNNVVALNPFTELPDEVDAINAILNEDRNAMYKQIESILGNMPDEANYDDESFEDANDDAIFDEDMNYDEDRDHFEDESYRIEDSNINDSSFDISKFQNENDDNDQVEPSIEIIDDDDDNINDHDSFHSSTFEEEDREDFDDNDDSFISINDNDNDPLMQARQLSNDDIKMQRIWQQLSNQIGQDVLMKAINYVKGNYENTDDDKFLSSLQYIIGQKSIDLYSSDLYELVLLMET